jgi:hypothetical protein
MGNIAQLVCSGVIESFTNIFIDQGQKRRTRNFVCFGLKRFITTDYRMFWLLSVTVRCFTVKYNRCMAEAPCRNGQCIQVAYDLKCICPPGYLGDSCGRCILVSMVTWSSTDCQPTRFLVYATLLYTPKLPTTFCSM